MEFIKDKSKAEKFFKIGKEFNINYPIFTYEEINMGNINHTYRVDYVVDDNTGLVNLKPFLFQCVNTFAFKDPVALMDNIDKVSEYIRKNKSTGVSLHFHHCNCNGKRVTYYKDGDEFWRICNYIPSITYDFTENLDVIKSTGVAFGEFQTLLSDFDANQLFYTIPDFHDTRKRYDALISEVFKDKKGRVNNVREELNYLFSVRDKACTLIDMYHQGLLPLRVTHNDTKINNVLFDKDTNEALTVIDLDTVMPGLAGNDFGDAIRFAANQVAEDSIEYDKAGIDLNVFWAFTEGFLSQTAKSFTDNEFDTFGISCFCITCELATRFLTDYISGDIYFKTTHPEHNLERARCQIALAKDIEKKLDAMNSIIKGCKEKYTK